MISTITDTCPYDCRLPVNLPNEFSGKQVKITIETIEPETVVEVPVETEEVLPLENKKATGKKS
jgi:hypothetical protein